MGRGGGVWGRGIGGIGGWDRGIGKKGRGEKGRRGIGG